MSDSVFEVMQRTSHLSGGNAAWIEQMYESFLEDPGAVSGEWRNYFERLPRVTESIVPDVPHGPVRTHFEMLGRNRHRTRPVVPAQNASEHERKQMRVDDLISAFRHRGHKRALVDPLEMIERGAAPMLDLSYHGLTDADFDTTFSPGTFPMDKEQVPLRELLDALKATYCGTVASEYMHLTDETERLWVEQRIEHIRGRQHLTAEERLLIHERLNAADGLEGYLQKRYPGTKRFGLEGGESLIPMLHEALQRSGSHGTREVVIGMAHRGRLNVLITLLGKHPNELFDEFTGEAPEGVSGSGDVKYHQGFSSNMMTPGGEIHVALGFNPSHLEIVAPVIEGSVRARQDRRDDPDGKLVLPILLHGDSAFCGQGVVMETFQMSQTRGFRTGGTVHIVLNNQIGFTTNKRIDIRSQDYCTEAAKMVEAPVFHVNGDDPDACFVVTQLALDYRMQFGKDVVIDLICYRRRGHNEAEDPTRTQPLMYQKIKKHPTTLKLYSDHLVAEGLITTEKVDSLAEGLRKALDNNEQVALNIVENPDSSTFVDWTPYLGHDWDTPGDTSFDKARFTAIGQQLSHVPDGIVVHRQVQRILDDRRSMSAGALPINWGHAETMAYATLLDQGSPVRLVGQDAGVGTFSHRHAVIHSQKDGTTWTALANMSEDQPVFEVYDSLLSEEAVLAFEYGYAATRPDILTIWEAQFGDFANGAQVVIDQFITSGEHKWARLAGLVMLLPHGYEGAGPEHSSARLERYLQLCAEHNIQVCVPSTPAQVFHMLRRQMIRPMRRPLIVMSPKSLLRHKAAVSTLEECCDGSFQTVIGDPDDLKPKAVTRVVLCSGKVYYDLIEARREAELAHVAIVRIEQLYPFPEHRLAEVLAPFTKLDEVIWCQEEPLNQGAWYPSQHHIQRVALGQRKGVSLTCASREASAAAAAGYMSLHVEQQTTLIRQALGIEPMEEG